MGNKAGDKFLKNMSFFSNVQKQQNALFDNWKKHVDVRKVNLDSKLKVL